MPDSKRRVDREAKTIPSLNHPHICVLYDIGHQQGVDYIVMGSNSRARPSPGAWKKGPLDQTLKYGAQIAAALATAHRLGIVHRDLKLGKHHAHRNRRKASGLRLGEANRSGRRTAPSGERRDDDPGAAQHPAALTQQGITIGNLPVHVAGASRRQRSGLAQRHVFLFGAVLYEMLTGKRAFQGRTQLSVVSAILEREPEPLSSVNPVPSPALTRTIQRCLAKDPDDRWQSASDLGMELKWIKRGAGANL